jgi:hypothetical protein
MSLELFPGQCILDLTQRQQVVTHVGQGVYAQLIREVDNGSRIDHRRVGIHVLHMLHVHTGVVFLLGLGGGHHGNRGDRTQKRWYGFLFHIVSPPVVALRIVVRTWKVTYDSNHMRVCVYA